MEINSYYLYRPKYFNMLVSATGQLSGYERIQRIKSIGLFNPWLAARCINTCVNDEFEVEDWLILRCISLYDKFGDLQSLVTLFELREYAIICDVLRIGKNNLFPFNDFSNINNIGISYAFSKLSKKMSIPLANKLFRRMIDLGYVMNVDAYNSIISKYKGYRNCISIYNEMSCLGLDADAKTYCLMIQRSSSFDTAIAYLDAFKSKANTLEDKILYTNVYKKILQLSKDENVIQNIFDEYMSFSFDFEQSIVIIYSYYNRMIERSISENKVDSIYSDFEQKYIIPFTHRTKKNHNNSEKTIIKYISKIIESYLVYKSKVIIQENDFLILLLGVLNRYSCYNIIPDCTKIVVTRIEKRGDFKSGKNLELLLRNYKINLKKIFYKIMIRYATTWDDANYLFQYAPFNTYNSIDMYSLLNKYGHDENQLVALFKRNIISIDPSIYFDLIPKISFPEAITFIEIITQKGIKIKRYIIEPLFSKWNSIKEFKHILRYVAKNDIDINISIIDNTIRRIQYLNIQKQFCNSFSDVKNKIINSLNEQWKKAINDICDRI